MPTLTPKPNSKLRFSLPKKAFAESKIDPESDIIPGVAIITVGPALGHGLWIDEEMVNSVVEAGNAKANGVKARFTHPGLCSDGLGTYLGKFRNFTLDPSKQIARADLYFSSAAKSSPKGDLAAYIKDLASDAPDSFGTSIVFDGDIGAMDRFVAEHEDEDGNFISPDPRNTDSYEHARLGKLYATDVVDEPAANAGGFFSEGEENAVIGEKMLNYLFDQENNEIQENWFGGLGSSRVKSFVNQYLERRNLHLMWVDPNIETVTMKLTEAAEAAYSPSVKAEGDLVVEQAQVQPGIEPGRISPSGEPEPEEEEIAPEQPSGEMPEDDSSDEMGNSANDNTVDLAALLRDMKELKEKVDALGKKDLPVTPEPVLQAEVTEKPEIQEMAKGTEPIPFNVPQETIQEDAFLELAKKIKQDENISLADAMLRAARRHPELHKAYLEK